MEPEPCLPIYPGFRTPPAASCRAELTPWRGSLKAAAPRVARAVNQPDCSGVYVWGWLSIRGNAMTSSTSRARPGTRGLIVVLAASIAAVLGPPIVSAQAAVHAAAGRAALAGAPSGGRATAAGPPGRQWASFAYDPARHELVLFGGPSDEGEFRDTWTR